MSVIAATQRRLAREEGGFTLIELLMAILCGVVVTGALFAILEISLHQTSRITDRVQATQLGRTAMTNIVDDLHSACLSRKFVPIKEKSTGKKIIFETAYSEKSLIEASEAVKHEITWTGTYPGSGELLDKLWHGTGGSWPTFEYTGTPTTVRLATNIYALTEAKKEVPIFRYYKYATTASEGGESTPSGALTSISPPELTGLTSAETATTASVLVSFAAAPTNNTQAGNYTALGRRAEFANQVTFAFSTPSSEATIEDGPCQ